MGAPLCVDAADVDGRWNRLDGVPPEEKDNNVRIEEMVSFNGPPLRDQEINASAAAASVASLLRLALLLLAGQDPRFLRLFCSTRFDCVLLGYFGFSFQHL